MHMPRPVRGFFIGYDQRAAGLQLGGNGGDAATASLLCLR